MNIAALLLLASQGDKAAQIKIARHALTLAAAGDSEINVKTVLLEAACFARLAAADGNVEGRMVLLEILYNYGGEMERRGEQGEADFAFGEALAHVDKMADDGDAFANDTIATLAGSSSPREMAFAKYFKKQWEQRK